jgi:TRAP-type transport system periplasmic protein
MATTIKCGLLALALVLVLCDRAQAQMHLGLTVDSVSENRIALLDNFKRAVEQRSGGTLLIDIKQHTDSVRDLPEQMGVLRAGELVGKVKEFGVFDLPYLIRSREHMKRIVDSSIMFRLASYARSADVEVLATLDGGFRELYSRDPISDWDDLAGKVVGGDWGTRSRGFDSYSGRLGTAPMAEFFRSFGADTPIGSDMSDSFGRPYGYVDVVDQPLDRGTSQKFLISYKFVFLTNHAFVPLFLVTSNRIWRGLSEEQRNAIKSAAVETQLLSFSVGARIDQTVLAGLRAHDGTNVKDERVAPLSSQSREAAREVWAEFAYHSVDGTNMLETIIGLGPRE